MKSVKSIKQKATFILIIFALNTIVAFACSLGLDMGYNSHSHYKDSKIEAKHTHGEGNKHLHLHKKATHSHSSAHRHNKSHGQADVKHTTDQKEDKDNCCTEKAKEFQEIDKLTPSLLHITYLEFFATFNAVYRTIASLPYTNIVRDLKPFVRNHHPPIPDIRIAIQSFLI